MNPPSLGFDFRSSPTIQGLAVSLDRMVSRINTVWTRQPHIYQSGYFTPTLQFGGLSTAIVYTFRTGYYTRIGDVVSVHIRLGLSANGTAVGAARLVNLPFSQAFGDAGNGIVAGAVAGYAVNFAALTGPVLGFVATTTLLLYHSGAAGGIAMTDANFTATSDMAISACYVTQDTAPTV